METRRQGGRDWGRKERRRKQVRTTGGKRTSKERFPISEKVQATMTSQRECLVTQNRFLLPTTNSLLPTDCSGKPSPALHAFQLATLCFYTLSPLKYYEHPSSRHGSFCPTLFSLCALFGVLPPFFLLSKLVLKHH